MRLSISNIAWATSENDEINKLFDELSITGVEVAPTKVWEHPLEQKQEEILRYRNYWNNRNRSVVALQSLLFGRPDLTIFENGKKREASFEYLSKIIELGASLGAKAFVFGSPKNRLIGDMPKHKAMEIAIPFFTGLGEVAEKFGTVFCIEPNPREYGCDFVCNTKEGVELVKAVNHPGFGIHLDTAALTINEEYIEESLNTAFPYLAHFHISEPYLQKVQHGKVGHRIIAHELMKLNYKQYISIEMRDGLSDSNLDTVHDSLRFVQEIYFG